MISAARRSCFWQDVGVDLLCSPSLGVPEPPLHPS